MLYYLASFLMQSFGPARLLQSYAVLIGLALFLGFGITVFLLPKFYNWLPHDRGREFTPTAEAAKGKPTGSGSVFITFFFIMFVDVDNIYKFLFGSKMFSLSVASGFPKAIFSRTVPAESQVS